MEKDPLKRPRDEDDTVTEPAPKKERSFLLDLFHALPVDAVLGGPELRENHIRFPLHIGSRFFIFIQSSLDDFDELLEGDETPVFWISCARESPQKIDSRIAQVTRDFPETKFWEPSELKFKKWDAFLDKTIVDLTEVLQQTEAQRIIITCRAGRERSLVKILLFHALAWNILNTKRQRQELSQLPPASYEQAIGRTTETFARYARNFISLVAERIKKSDSIKYRACALCQQQVELTLVLSMLKQHFFICSFSCPVKI